MRLILYSKPGCHLCEGLQEKLEQITDLSFELEVRDITTRPEWQTAYQYEIPIMFWLKPGSDEAIAIPRPSPRASVAHLERTLRKYL